MPSSTMESMELGRCFLLLLLLLLLPPKLKNPDNDLVAEILLLLFISSLPLSLKLDDFECSSAFRCFFDFSNDE